MPPIRNFVQLTPNIACSGQPAADQFSLIADFGYQHVINPGKSDHPDAVLNEDQLLSALHINYFHIPVRFEQPKPEQLRLFCQLMRSLGADRVLVHCIMNYRASAFLYQYLIQCEDYDDRQARTSILNDWNIPAVWLQLMSWTRQDIGLK